MRFYRNYILIFGFIILTGCGYHHKKDVYEQGYRNGVQEQVKQVASQFQGGNFPYYHWSSPLVQQVKVPAHLSSGAMIPEHDELVIIKPGEWIISPAYPIKTQQRNNYEKKSTSMDMDLADLTSLPKSMGHASSDDE